MRSAEKAHGAEEARSAEKARRAEKARKAESAHRAEKVRKADMVFAPSPAQRGRVGVGALDGGCAGRREVSAGFTRTNQSGFMPDFFTSGA